VCLAPVATLGNSLVFSLRESGAHREFRARSISSGHSLAGRRLRLGSALLGQWPVAVPPGCGNPVKNSEQKRQKARFHGTSHAIPIMPRPETRYPNNPPKDRIIAIEQKFGNLEIWKFGNLEIWKFGGAVGDLPPESEIVNPRHHRLPGFHLAVRSPESRCRSYRLGSFVRQNRNVSELTSAACPERVVVESPPVWGACRQARIGRGRCVPVLLRLAPPNLQGGGFCES
jgi:hypothetical protein